MDNNLQCQSICELAVILNIKHYQMWYKVSLTTDDLQSVLLANFYENTLSNSYGFIWKNAQFSETYYLVFLIYESFI